MNPTSQPTTPPIERATPQGEKAKRVDCEKLGIYHAWVAIKDERAFLTYPVTYPPARRQCLNCGRQEKYIITHQEVAEWIVEK